MASQNLRRAIFWTSCIPLRAFMAACMTFASLYQYRVVELLLAGYAGFVGGGLGVNFARQELRARPVPRATAPSARSRSPSRGNFGGVVWWHRVRPAHALLLFVYSALALASYPFAGVFACLDVGLAIGVGVARLGPRRERTSAAPAPSRRTQRRGPHLK